MTSSAAALLGIDLGTGSVKVALTDTSGAVLAQAETTYPVDRPQPGWAQTDPDAWWSAVRESVRRVVATGAGTPCAIGLSGQMHGVVLTSADAVPVHPAVLWADARATAELDAYRELPEQVLARLGNPLTTGMAGPTLAWLARHGAATVRAARWALQPKDWIRARLTGVVAGEHSDASATLLYDVLEGRWCGEVVEHLGLRRELFPELLDHSGAPAGTLLPEVAHELGVRQGIPVAAGAADTAAALVGTGLFDVGVRQLTVGTGVQVVTPVRPPGAGRLDPLTHLFRDATASGWYAMAAGLTGGQTLDWVRRLLGADWAELYAAAAAIPNGTDPLFLPHLVGERTPYLDPAMRGAWTDLDPRHDRTALMRSALEGVAFAISEAFAALPWDPSRPDVRIAGGGTTAPGFRALLATVLDARLRAVDVSAASARGAALLGGWAAGEFDDQRFREVASVPARTVAEPGAHADVLRERRARWTRRLAALKDTDAPDPAPDRGENHRAR